MGFPALPEQSNVGATRNAPMRSSEAEAVGARLHIKSYPAPLTPRVSQAQTSPNKSSSWKWEYPWSTEMPSKALILMPDCSPWLSETDPAHQIGMLAVQEKCTFQNSHTKSTSQKDHILITCRSHKIQQLLGDLPLGAQGQIEFPTLVHLDSRESRKNRPAQKGEGIVLVNQPTDLFVACYFVINCSTRFNWTSDIGGYALYVMKHSPQKIVGITKEYQWLTNKHQYTQLKHW